MIQIILAILTFSLPLERLGSFNFLNFNLRLSQLALLLLNFIIFWEIIKVRFQKKTFIVSVDQPEKSNNFIPYSNINFQYFTQNNIPLIFFFLITVINSFFSPEPKRSFLILAFIIFTASLSFILPYFIKTEKIFLKTIKILLISSFLFSLFGLYQFFGDALGLNPKITGIGEQYQQKILGFPRLMSTAKEPLYFANFLLISLSLSLSFLLFKENTKKTKYLLLSLFFILNLALLLTASRGAFLAYLGMIIGTITILIIINIKTQIFSTLKKQTSFKTLLLPITTIILSILMAYISTKITTIQNPDTNYLKHITNFSYGAGILDREKTWGLAIKLFLEKPFLGWGLGSFGVYAKNLPDFQKHQGYPITNNLSLELLCETGLIGFSLFAIFIFFIFKKAYKIITINNNYSLSKIILIGLIISLLGILIQYQTFSTLYLMHFWFLLGIIISLENILKLEQK